MGENSSSFTWDQSANGYRQTAAAAGGFKSNAWGLCDMHGNVGWVYWKGTYETGGADRPGSQRLCYAAFGRCAAGGGTDPAPEFRPGDGQPRLCGTQSTPATSKTAGRTKEEAHSKQPYLQGLAGRLNRRKTGGILLLHTGNSSRSCTQAAEKSAEILVQNQLDFFP